MSDRDKIKKYLRKEMRRILIQEETRTIRKQKIDFTTFGFCWTQAKFDVLMDIDRELKLGAFYKKAKRKIICLS